MDGWMDDLMKEQCPSSNHWEVLMLGELGGQCTFSVPLDLQLSARSPPGGHWPLFT